MKKLIFRMKYADKKWPEYLTEVFGAEVANKCKVMSYATADKHNARIDIYNFDGNQKVIDTLKNNQQVISAFIVENNEVQKTIV